MRIRRGKAVAHQRLALALVTVENVQVHRPGCVLGLVAMPGGIAREPPWWRSLSSWGQSGTPVSQTIKMRSAHACKELASHSGVCSRRCGRCEIRMHHGPDLRPVGEIARVIDTIFVVCRVFSLPCLVFSILGPFFLACRVWSFSCVDRASHASKKPCFEGGLPIFCRQGALFCHGCQPYLALVETPALAACWRYCALEGGSLGWRWCRDRAFWVRPGVHCAKCGGILC